MERNRYLYLGDKTGSRIFYDAKEDKFYQSKQLNSGLQTSVTAFAGIILYTVVQRLNGEELNYNETAFVICSAVTGILLAVISCWHTIKANDRYFSTAIPAEVLSAEQMAKVLRQASSLTRIYGFARVLLLGLILFIPFLLKEQNNIFLFVTYFLVWFAWGYVILCFNQRKRRKILKRLKKQYL